MPQFRLPIFYKHYAAAIVEAENLDDAISLFNGRLDNDADEGTVSIDDESMQEPNGHWEVDEEAIDEDYEGEDVPGA